MLAPPSSPGSVPRLTRLPQRQDFCFQVFESRESFFNRRRARFLRSPRMDQGLLCDAGDVVEKFSYFRLQPVAAFLNPIQDVALHARTVDFKQVTEELQCASVDETVQSGNSQGQVRQPPQRRGRLRHFDEIAKDETGPDVEPGVLIKRVRHPRQSTCAGVSQPYQKIVSNLNKAPGDLPVFRFSLRLLGLKPTLPL